MRFTEFLIEQHGDITEYEGFKLEQYEDYEEDNTKIFHTIYTPEGERHWIDHTPYEWLDKRDLAKYVEFYRKHGRFPERKDVHPSGSGPIRQEDLDMLLRK